MPWGSCGRIAALLDDSWSHSTVAVAPTATRIPRHGKRLQVYASQVWSLLHRFKGRVSRPSCRANPSAVIPELPLPSRGRSSPITHGVDHGERVQDPRRGSHEGERPAERRLRRTDVRPRPALRRSVGPRR
jgi:hypothetical protein